MRRFRVVVIGCGRMGRNHLRVLGEDPGFDVVGVVDPACANGRIQPPSGHEVPVLASIDALVGKDGRPVCDCAVVASPTGTHHAVASRLVGMGVSVLVEKPLVHESGVGEGLIAQARAAGVVLAVGHVERFNPAVIKLREVLEAGWLGTPIHFSFTRVGGYPSEIAEGNNVLLDLAVHDLDLLELLHGSFQVVSSICHSTLRPDVLDTAEILLAHAAGASASVHVNWVTPTKVRSVRVTGTRGVVFVDYILQTVRLMGGNLLNASRANRTSFDQIVEDYRNCDQIEFGVHKHEPLKLEIRAFWEALCGHPSAICTGAEGLRAVRLAEAAIRESRRGIRAASDASGSA
jgi:UDP-N-acetylglucosamine 3-dehydrogenase